jgi:hypothetical protein
VSALDLNEALNLILSNGNAEALGEQIGRGISKSLTAALGAEPLTQAAPEMKLLLSELTDEAGGTAIPCRGTRTYQAAPNGTCDCWACDWARRVLAVLAKTGGAA